MQFTSHNHIRLERDEQHAYTMQIMLKFHHQSDFQYGITFQLTLHQIVIHGVQFKWLLTAKKWNCIRCSKKGTQHSYKTSRFRCTRSGHHRSAIRAGWDKVNVVIQQKNIALVPAYVCCLDSHHDFVFNDSIVFLFLRCI